MSKMTKNEVLEKLRGRYATAGPEHRIKLIDQAVALIGYHRKSAIRALAAPPVTLSMPGIIGRPPVYDRALLLPPLKKIWLSVQQPCGKRLAAMMPDWVPAYEGYFQSLPGPVREQLLQASPATLDRLLRDARAQTGRRGSQGTKPGTMLRESIPIRGGSWHEEEPGWTEVDTVSFCGGTVRGENLWIVDNTDICTTWVEMRGMHGRGQLGTVEQLRDIEQAQPFVWQGIDSDNGGEFINRHVLSWCQKGRAQPIYYTRSRPYRSNDNAHVEQKNWTHPRHWFGYERHDNPDVVPLVNQLARGALGQFVNLFSPSAKLERKEPREGVPEHRVYGKPLTPYARVMANAHISPARKEELRALKESLNPFALEASIQKQLKAIERVRLIRER